MKADELLEIRHRIMMTLSHIMYSAKELEKASDHLKEACGKYTELLKEINDPDIKFLE